MADPFAPPSSDRHPAQDTTAPATRTGPVLPDAAVGRLVDAGASDELVFLLGVGFGQLDDAERDEAIEALADLDSDDAEELRGLIAESEEMLDEGDRRQRVAERDPETVESLLEWLADEDVEEVEVPADGETTGEVSGNGTGEALDEVTNGEQESGGVPPVPEAAEGDGQDPEPEPAAETAAEPEPEDGDPQYRYPDDQVPTGAKDVVSWIAAHDETDPLDEKERAWAALRIERTRDGGLRSTVIERIEKAVGSNLIGND